MLRKISVTTSLVAVFCAEHYTCVGNVTMRVEAIKRIFFFGKPEGKGPLMRPRCRRFEVVLKNLTTPSDIILLQKSRDDQLVKKLSPLYGYRRLPH